MQIFYALQYVLCISMAAGMGVMEYPDELKLQNTEVRVCHVRASHYVAFCVVRLEVAEVEQVAAGMYL